MSAVNFSSFSAYSFRQTSERNKSLIQEMMHVCLDTQASLVSKEMAFHAIEGFVNQPIVKEEEASCLAEALCSIMQNSDLPLDLRDHAADAIIRFTIKESIPAPLITHLSTLLCNDLENPKTVSFR